VGHRRGIERRLANRERLRLHSQIDFRVAVGGLQTDMAEPSANNINFHAGLQQMDGSGVAQDMGRDRLSGVNYLVRSASIILAGELTLLSVFGFSSLGWVCLGSPLARYSHGKEPVGRLDVRHQRARRNLPTLPPFVAENEINERVLRRV
jgi:hypothetical protein